jgi:hypothetical protein
MTIAKRVAEENTTFDVHESVHRDIILKVTNKV